MYLNQSKNKALKILSYQYNDKYDEIKRKILNNKLNYGLIRTSLNKKKFTLLLIIVDLLFPKKIFCSKVKKKKNTIAIHTQKPCNKKLIETFYNIQENFENGFFQKFLEKKNAFNLKYFQACEKNEINPLIIFQHNLVVPLNTTKKKSMLKSFYYLIRTFN